MGKLEFITTSRLSPEKLFNYILDFEYYPNYFPMQIKSVKILEHTNNEILTEEKIVFSTLLQNVIDQKSKHTKISDNHMTTEITEGPAKGSIVNIICNKTESGSTITFTIDLKLSLKAKFLEPLIKKLYKRYLLALVLKMNNRELAK